MRLPRTNNPDVNRAFGIVEQEDARNVKKGQDIQLADERIILRSPNGTAYAIVVSNAGALSTVAV